jgi:hypothetical protein
VAPAAAPAAIERGQLQNINPDQNKDDKLVGLFHENAECDRKKKYNEVDLRRIGRLKRLRLDSLRKKLNKSDLLYPIIV